MAHDCLTLSGFGMAALAEHGGRYSSLLYAWLGSTCLQAGTGGCRAADTAARRQLLRSGVPELALYRVYATPMGMQWALL
jgi:hypothetical protein